MPNINLPNINISENDLKSEETMKQLVDTLYKYKKELNYLLMNLDEENMPKIVNTIKDFATQSEVTQTAENLILEFGYNGTNQEFKKGISTFGINGLKVEHSDFPGQYSEIRADGFVRKWASGESAYLNDIYTFTGLASDNDRDSPNPLTIPLPDRFKNRTDLVAILVPKDWRASRLIYVNNDNTIAYGLDYIDLWTSVSITTGLNPTANVTAYLETRLEDEETSDYRIRFRDVGFDLIIFGY